MPKDTGKRSYEYLKESPCFSRGRGSYKAIRNDGTAQHDGTA